MTSVTTALSKEKSWSKESIGLKRLKAALAPYTTTAAPRPADRALVVTVSYEAAEVTRAVKLSDLEDPAKLADVINDF